MLDIFDDDHCNRIIWCVAKELYRNYCRKTEIQRLTIDDFCQEGWLTIMKIRKSDCVDLSQDPTNYVCVALRRAMIKQYKSINSIVKMPDYRSSDYNPKLVNYYIAGNEFNLDAAVEGRETLSVLATIDEEGKIHNRIGYKERYDEVLDEIMIQQLLDTLEERYRVELIRRLNGLPPLRRGIANHLIDCCRKVFNGTYIPKKVLPKGISFDTSCGKYAVTSNIEGFKKIGRFSSLEEAAECLERFNNDLKHGALKISKNARIRYSYKYKRWVVYKENSTKKLGKCETFEEAQKLLEEKCS